MDVNRFFNHGGDYVKNPNYKKGNGQPKYIISVDANPTNVSSVLSGTADIQTVFNPDKTSDRFARSILDYNLPLRRDDYLNNEFNDILAEQQSALSKAFHSLEQAIVSETLIGIPKGLADLSDLIASKVFRVGNGNYTNPVSEYLNNLQDTFNNEVAPIYSDSKRNTIADGGLLNMGWWASNFPSVMSTLTLLVPGEGMAKGLSWLGKSKFLNGKSIGNLTRSSVRSLTGAANKKWKDLSDFQKFTNSNLNVKLANTGLEVGINAATMRAIENYQEAQETHKTTYTNSLNKLNSMDDAQYAAFVERNKDKLGDIDYSDKDAVAKTIAKQAADETFKLNWANAVFDVIQVGALRNMFRGGPNNLSSFATRRMQRESLRWYGKTDAEKKALREALPWKTRIKDFASDALFGGKTVFLAEATEGLEEAWNYISQEEGKYVANTLLKGYDGTTFGSRLINDYLRAPELYDSAFWGVMGGIMFHIGGSGFHRLSNKLTESKEEVDTDSKYQWGQELENSENKRRIDDLRLRETDMQAYNVVSQMINDNKNPYQKKEDGSFAEFSSEAEKEAAKARLWKETVSKVALRSRDAGNLDLTEEFYRSKEVRDAMIEEELKKSQNPEQDRAKVSAEVNARMDEALAITEHADDVYTQEWYNVSNLANEYAHRNKNYDKPLEYLNIIARENASRELQLERFDESIEFTDAKMRSAFADVEKALNRGKKPEQRTTIDEYYDNIKTIVIADRLGRLRAERVALNREKALENTNSKELRLQQIQEQIDQLEAQLEPLALHWATAMSLRYVQNGNQLLQIDTKEFREYEDAIKNNDYSKIDKEIVDISEQAMSSIASTGINIHLDYDNLKRRMQKLLNTNKEYNTGDFRTLANTKAYMEIQRIGLESELIDTYDKFEYKNKVLDNVLNAARLEAINTAKANLKELYKKYGDVIDDLLDLQSLNNAQAYNDFMRTASNEEVQQFEDAYHILNLHERHNRGVYGDLRREFAAIKANAAQGTNATQNSSTIQNTNSATSTTASNNISGGTQQTNTGQANGQNEPLMPPPPPATTPKTLFLNIDAITGDITESNTHTDVRAIADNNGDFILETTNSDKNIIGNDELFKQDNINWLNPNTDVEVETNPILSYDSNTKKFTVKEKGTLVEVAKDDAIVSSTGEEEQPIGTGQTSVPPATPPITPVTPVTPAESAPSNELTSGQQEALAEAKIRNDVASFLRDNVTVTTDTGTYSINDYNKNHKGEKITSNSYESTDFNALKNNYTGVRPDNFDEIWTQNIDDLDFYILILNSGASNLGLDGLATNVVMNSTIADDGGVTQFTLSLQNAINELIDNYAKEMGLEKHNDIYYINLENLARHIYENTNHKHNAAIIIDILTRYADTVGNISYKLVDESDAKSGRIYDNYKTPSTDNVDESLRSSEMQRVEILTLLKTLGEEESKAWNTAFESLEAGEELNYEFDGNKVIIKKDDVVLGTMTKALFDGLYHQNIKGWNLSLDASGIDASANLKDIFASWLTTKGNNSIDKINNIAYKLAYNKLTKEQREELIKEFWNVLKNDANLKKLIGKDIIDSYVNSSEPIDLYVSLIKYKENYGAKYRAKQNDIINKTLTAYFNNLRTSYQQLDWMFDNKNLKIVVDKVNQSDIEFGKDFNNLTEVIVGGYNPSMHKLGIGIDSNGNNIVSGEGVVYRSETDNGWTSVFIKTKSGRTYRVQGAPISVKDATGDIKIVRDEFENIIKRLLRERKLTTDKEANFDEIANLLKLMFYNGENYKSLFGNIVVTETDNGIFIGTSKDNGFWIYRHNQDGTAAMSIAPIGTYADEWNKKHPNEKYITYYDTTNSVRSVSDAVDSIMQIFDNARFKVSKDHLIEDGVTNSSIDNTIGRMKNGKFVIELNGKELVSRESYSDFMLSNNYVKVRLREALDNPGSNYRRTNTRQGANKALYVRIEPSTPVEENNEIAEDEVVSEMGEVKDSVIEALDDNATTTSILNIVFPTIDNVRLEDIFGSLPIVYDDSIPGYAQWRKTGTNREIAIGSMIWGLSINEAARQIIHELIHNKIDEVGRDKLKKLIPIYNEFVDILKKQDTIVQEELSRFLRINDSNRDSQHLFEHFDSKNITEEELVDLEDFLNYSLMNKSLYDALNKFETTDRNTRKTSIFQKIIEFIQDVFGGVFKDVNKGSLLQKELNTLNRIFGETVKAESKPRKRAVKVNPSVKQLSLPSIDNTKKKVEDTVKEYDDSDVNSFVNDIFDSDTEFDAKDSTLSDKYVTSVKTLREDVPSESVNDVNKSINNGDTSISCK